MKKVPVAIFLALLATPAFAQYGGGWGTNPNTHQTQGYIRNNGTVVSPHIQTNPNSTRNDNLSTYGNVNPYTGQTGTRRTNGF